MTDDRAKRLRDLRNRTGRTRADDEESDSNEPETADSDDETEPADSDDTESDDEAESETITSERDSTSDGSDDSSPSEPSQSTAEPADEATAPDDERAQTRDETTAGGTQPTPTDEPAGQPTGQLTPPSNDARGTGNDATAEVETVSYGETDAVSQSPADASPRASDQQLDPALQGAIADTSALAGSIGTLGSEPTVDSSAILEETEEYGRATVDRGSAAAGHEQTLLHSAHDDATTVQMLEFFLNGNRYAIEIDRVSAIVEMKDITRFPRGPEAIDGVTDLRGEITGVLDPTVVLDVERSTLSDDQYIVVLKRDDDKQKLGIRVTDVSQAVTYRESQIDETGAVMDLTDGRQHEFIRGIIKKTADERTSLVTWLDIDAIIEHTE